MVGRGGELLALCLQGIPVQTAQPRGNLYDIWTLTLQHVGHMCDRIQQVSCACTGGLPVSFRLCSRAAVSGRAFTPLMHHFDISYISWAFTRACRDRSVFETANSSVQNSKQQTAKQ